MRRRFAILLLLGLTGCVSEPDPYYGDGPYYYDGGYYDSPRAFDYAVEQRAVYSNTYYYPGGNPYYWGGYGRPWYYTHPDRDYRHHDDNDGPGRTRERDTDYPSSSAHPDASHDRAVPDRPAKVNIDRSPSSSDRGGSSGRSSGGPHGGGRR